MKPKLLIILLLALTGAGAGLLACGNKFLVPSRGTRFGKAPVARQVANILVYSRPDSALSKALGSVSVATILAEAGYKPTTVSGPEEFDAALSKGGWALVLADLDDTASFRERLRGGDAPSILPVLHEPSRTEMAEAKQAYGQVLRTPTKSQRFLETVDYAVAERAQRHASVSQPAVTP
jgi:hypothetical protein